MAFVFSTIVAVGISFAPTNALAHGWDRDGDSWRHQHDNGLHKGWYKHEERVEAQRRSQLQCERPLPYRSGWNQPAYGSTWNGSIDGRVNPRHPGLVWTCDSDGHHCGWERRANYNHVVPRPRVNPAEFGGAYNQPLPYGDRYYGSSQYGPVMPMLAPLFGGQR